MPQITCAVALDWGGGWEKDVAGQAGLNSGLSFIIVGGLGAHRAQAGTGGAHCDP